MTWDDYRPIPGVNWADPALVPERGFKIAVVAQVTARAVDPLPGTFAGIVVRLDGPGPRDRTPPDDPATNPLSPGTPNYDFYSMEVVQRIGNDSFTPDHGVLLAKNKDSLRGRNGGPNEFNSYIWVIDAHPEDMGMVDYVKPNGEEVMRTIADYRQLNDALFHAGLNSGSEFEWLDPHNRLHFYVVDRDTSETGIISYTLGVRSLDGAGTQARGVELQGPEEIGLARTQGTVEFSLANTGATAPLEPGLHPDDVTPFVGGDIYRLSIAVEGEGWSAQLQNALAAVEAGGSTPVTVGVRKAPGASSEATLSVTAVSESDPETTAILTVPISG
jgi:hypothetical protein